MCVCVFLSVCVTTTAGNKSIIKTLVDRFMLIYFLLVFCFLLIQQLVMRTLLWDLKGILIIYLFPGNHLCWVKNDGWSFVAVFVR